VAPVVAMMVQAIASSVEDSSEVVLTLIRSAWATFTMHTDATRPIQ
jgi:hypothetical protein